MPNTLLQKLLPFDSFNRAAKLFLLCVVINGIIFSAWQLFFNFFVLGLGYDKAFLGIVNSLPSVAALFLGLPMGVLSDRIGRRQAMLLGLLVYTLAAGVMITFPTRPIFISMSLLAGLGNTMFFISQSPFLMKVSTPQNRSLLFSLNFGLLTLSGAVGNIFAGQLPAFFGRILQVEPRSAAAYQAVLIASILLGATALIPLFLIKEPSVRREDHKKEQSPTGRSVLRLTILLALPNLIIGFGAAILMPYLNVFFREIYHMPDGPLGILFSLSSILTGIGSILGPALANRMGSKIRAVLITQGSSLIFLALLALSSVWWLAAVGFLLRAMLMNMAAPLYGAFGMEQIPPRAQGTVNSVLSVAWQVGWAVGPYLSGLVQETYGFGPLFITTGACYLAAIILTAVFFYKMDPPIRHTQPEVTQA